MTFINYNKLEELQQAEAAWNKGVLLAEREEDFHKIMLYQLEDFYIEVTWHSHFNVILKVCSFNTTDHLDPYLEQIDLKEIYSGINS
jgi:hypothetical protein